MSDETPEPKRARKPSVSRPPAPRRGRGFLSAAELAPTVLKSTGAKRGFAELRLLTEWRAVVGEALAGVCRPLKVSYGGRSGAGLGATLVIAAEGARAPEIEMQKTRIIERVNTFYGYRAISRIAIDQSRAPLLRMPNGMAETATPFEGPPPQPVAGVADDHLALALARLGANVRAKSRRADNG
ncbi:MAG: DUF721 domain-containing protein [Paracoccaceae bacterium]